MPRLATVPSLLMTGIPRAAVAIGQMRLAEAQKELGTGRHHDVGLALGSRIDSDIRHRLSLNKTNQAIDVAKQAGVRAGMVQTALGSLTTLADQFLSALSAARGAEQGQMVIRDAARSSLTALTQLVNVTFDGQYLFGGISSDRPPLLDYGGGAPQAAVDAAFASEFGLAQADPLVSQITGPDMSNFLDGVFSGLFSPVEWQANWSQAASVNLSLRIDTGAGIDLTSNGNASFVPKLAEAFTAMMALGQGNLSRSAFEATASKAMSLISEAKLEIGTEQSRIGISQQRIDETSARLEKTKRWTSEAVTELESVDPYEVATRVNLLMTQLEASYEVTSRISRLSILNYL